MTVLDFVIIGAMFLATLVAGGAIIYLVMTVRQSKPTDQDVEQQKPVEKSSYWTAEATDDC